MTAVNLEYIAAGGNRHPSAADWAPGLLAFGAANNVALWNPDDGPHKGIHALLAGHSDIVNAVKIYDVPRERSVITGSADKTIRIWKQSAEDSAFEQVQCLKEHQGSINTMSVLPEHRIFVSGGADGTMKVWEYDNTEARLIESISIQPRLIPLTSALVHLDDGTIVLAVAGTSTSILLYARSAEDQDFKLQATLTGHEGWIRSLDFSIAKGADTADVLLASASQDKFIRLWRFHKRHSPLQKDSTATMKSISNKAHRVGSDEHRYTVTFEALLIGHEDWIYSTRWIPQRCGDSAVQLLSASADNSLAIWEADKSSGVWICKTRLGEISSQKGSTTATGSTGGFWTGLWAPDGQEVVCLGRTGGWRRWKYDHRADIWLQQLGIGGHTLEIRTLTWASDGSYLLTTGSDQTTRLFAEWKRDEACSWHELSRPQIHGYDLNCIDSISPNRFISGADEKLLRVFNKPKAVANLLSCLSGSHSQANELLPDGASIPVLGLSNKAIDTASQDETDLNGTTDSDFGNADDGQKHPNGDVKEALELTQPPYEDHLARQTLWPEHEKLYGHGYEISAVAASHDGSLVATACKASSIDHAVIRLYDCHEWREVKPSLAAHNLTVTALAFSHDDRYLLSVSRDRQWTVFERDADNANAFRLVASNPKAHTRMILDCSWAPSGQNEDVFATAGRDKSVKVWRRTPSDAFECVGSLNASTSVTAVAFDVDCAQQEYRLAYGTEDGVIRIVRLEQGSLDVKSDVSIARAFLPSGAINSLCWRPQIAGVAPHQNHLAVGSDDTSLRIYMVGR